MYVCMHAYMLVCLLIRPAVPGFTGHDVLDYVSSSGGGALKGKSKIPDPETLTPPTNRTKKCRIPTEA